MPLARSICRPKWIACLACRTEIGAVHHAPFVSLGGGERASGQNDLLGPPLADRARQVLRSAGAGHDAERDLGQREAGILGGVNKVAAQRQFATAGISGAVDRADDRDGAADKRPDHALEQQMLVLPGLVGHAVALLEVAAGAKRPLPRAGQDDTTLICGRCVDRVEKRQEIAAHLRVHRVGHLRAIEG